MDANETFNPDYISSAESLEHLHTELLDKASTLAFPLMIVWKPVGAPKPRYFSAKMVEGWPVFWEIGKYNSLFGHIWALHFAREKNDYPLASSIIEEAARDAGTTWNSAEFLLSEILGE